MSTERVTTLEGEEPVWCGSDKAGFAIYSDTERRLVPTDDIIRRIRALQQQNADLRAALEEIVETLSCRKFHHQPNPGTLCRWRSDLDPQTWCVVCRSKEMLAPLEEPTS